MVEENADTQNQNNSDTSDQQNDSQQDQKSQVVPQWYDSFQDSSLKADDGIKKYKTLDDFGKAFKEKDSMIGRKGVILPKDNDQSDKERFYNQLGRPEVPDNYKLPEIQIEDEFKQFVSEDKLNGFKKLAHKYGLTQEQFEGITKEYTNVQLNEIKNVVYSENKKFEDAQTKLMNEWLVDYDGNAKQAELAMKSFSNGVDENKLAVLLQDPDVKKIFFNVSQVISEDKLRTGDSKRTETAQSLQAFIDSQVKDMKSSYYNQKAPDHKAAKEKVRQAYEQLAAIRKVG